MNGCPLCSPDKKSRWYETDLTFALCFDCETCNTPMFVHKGHVPEFTILEKGELMSEAMRMFGARALVRWEMRKVQDHAHCHVELRAEEEE